MVNILRSTPVQCLREVSLGIQRLHRQGLVLGNLQPKNLLLTRVGEPRLYDLTACREVADDLTRTEGESNVSS